MENMQKDWKQEHKRLEETLKLAESQLEQARHENELTRNEIIEAKRELRDNTEHSFTNLYSADDFEALAELSQYINPVTTKIADFESMENKILQLEKLIKAPYFARVDFKFDGEDIPEQIYIGRTSLKKNKFDMFIYDWRSPIASVFYRFVLGAAFYDAPGGRIDGEVSLKRQYEIKDSRLEYFFDADVQIVDEFLRKMLSQNTSVTMKTIVETIQREQDIVIRDMDNDLLMVQGVAGSGKTSIALHRAAYLMYQGLSSRLTANNIIIISPNTLFEQYISNVLPELGESNVESVVFEEILAAILQNRRIQSRNQLLENMITSGRSNTVIKRSMEYKTSLCFMEILNRFIEDIPERFILFEDVYYDGIRIAERHTLKKKISGRKETPLGIKLKQLEDWIWETIAEVHKKRINRAEEAAVQEELHRYTEINLYELYRKLVNDREYFHSLAADGNDWEVLEEIRRYTCDHLADPVLHYDDAIVLTFLHLRIYGSGNYKNIKQVVIDEAQDYYPLQYQIFSLLFPNSKFTVLGDMNQTLEKQEDISIYTQIGEILNRKKASLITMDKSFRCTNEILRYSLKFIDQSPEIRSFNRKGEEPEVCALADQTQLCDAIAQEVAWCRAQGYASIGLICKTEENTRLMHACLRDRLELQLITDDSHYDLQGVFIIPVYMSKGLEFDAVLVCDADILTYTSEEDRKFLYIACTRALHRLNLFCLGEPSPLL